MSNPTQAQDAATKNYVDSNFSKVFSTNYTFGTSTTVSPTRLMTISNTSFTSTNVLLGLVIIPQASTVFTDTFTMTNYTDATFVTGSFSANVTITRTDTNGGWNQNVILQVIILYR